jgi:hypothetical protein
MNSRVLFLVLLLAVLDKACFCMERGGLGQSDEIWEEEFLMGSFKSLVDFTEKEKTRIKEVLEKTQEDLITTKQIYEALKIIREALIDGDQTDENVKKLANVETAMKSIEENLEQTAGIEQNLKREFIKRESEEASFKKILDRCKDEFDDSDSE